MAPPEINIDDIDTTMKSAMLINMWHAQTHNLISAKFQWYQFSTSATGFIETKCHRDFSAKLKEY